MDNEKRSDLQESYGFSENATSPADEGAGKPEKKPKKKMSKKKKITLWCVFGSLGLVFVAAAVILGLLFWPILFENPVLNTFDRIVFDTGMLMDAENVWLKKGALTDVEISLPQELTNYEGDVTLKINAAALSKSDSGTMEFVLDTKNAGFTVNIIYDEDKIAIGGLCPGASNEYIFIPRKDVEDALSKSVFHPESDSVYAMKKGDYEELVKTLCKLEHDEDSRKKEELNKIIKNISDEITNILSPKSKIELDSQVFRLKKTTEIELDDRDIEDIIDVILNEIKGTDLIDETIKVSITGANGSVTEMTLETVLKNYQKSLFDTEINIRYVESNGLIRSVEIEEENCADTGIKTETKNVIEFFYNDREAGFSVNSTAKARLGNSVANIKSESLYIREEDKYSVEFNYSTQQETTDQKGLSVTVSSGASLSYDKAEKTYVMKLTDSNGKGLFGMDGTFDIDPKKGKVEFCIDKINVHAANINSTLVFKVAVSTPQNKMKVTMPQNGTDLCSIDDAGMLSLIADMDLRALKVALDDVFGEKVPKKIYLDETGSPIHNYLAVEISSDVYAYDFKNYISKNDPPSDMYKIYVYNETQCIYHVLDYYDDDKTVQVRYYYRLDDSVKNSYKEATLTNGKLTLE